MCVYIYTHMYTHIHMHTFLCMHACMYACMHVCMYVYRKVHTAMYFLGGQVTRSHCPAPAPTPQTSVPGSAELSLPKIKRRPEEDGS